MQGIIAFSFFCSEISSCLNESGSTQDIQKQGSIGDRSIFGSYCKTKEINRASGLVNIDERSTCKKLLEYDITCMTTKAWQCTGTGVVCFGFSTSAGLPEDLRCQKKQTQTQRRKRHGQHWASPYHLPPRSGIIVPFHPPIVSHTSPHIIRSSHTHTLSPNAFLLPRLQSPNPPLFLQ